MTELRTHCRLDPDLCGRPVRTAPGEAEVALLATEAMAADGRGLVHGGFAGTFRCAVPGHHVLAGAEETAR